MVLRRFAERAQTGDGRRRDWGWQRLHGARDGQGAEDHRDGCQDGGDERCE
jgi:hypothetical protein